MVNLGDKSITRSLTILAVVLFAVIQALEGLGVVPSGTLQEIAVVGKGLATILFGYGVRRAISANGLPALLDELGRDEDGDTLDEPDADYELTDADFEDDEPDVRVILNGIELEEMP